MTVPIEIVEGPSPIAELEMLEGLDAREALPPVRPASREQLMSLDELNAWERDQIASARIDELQSGDVERFDRARAAVPAPLSWPEAPDQLESIWFSLVGAVVAEIRGCADAVCSREGVRVVVAVSRRWH